MTKKNNAELADFVILDAKRLIAIRSLAIMKEYDREIIMAKLPDRDFITAASFDEWTDKLVEILTKPRGKLRRATVPNEV